MIPLTQYIVENNEGAALELAKKYGIPYRDKNELAMQLHRALKSEDEDFIRDLASIHPDRELFEATESEEKSNCCGSGADGSASTMEEKPVVPVPAKTETSGNQNQMMQLAMAAVLVVAIVAIAK